MFIIVMCIDYNANTRHGICGSPDNTLETFTYSEVHYKINNTI